MSRWQNSVSMLPSIMMPCPCGGRMKMTSDDPIRHSNGSEDIAYRCSICRKELVATRIAATGIRPALKSAESFSRQSLSGTPVEST